MEFKKPKFYSYRNCPKEIKVILDKIVENFKNILQDNLIGIYLHGSLAMGCFNPKSGDIDFLVIVNNKLDIETKKKIISIIFRLSKTKHVPPKGFEFSVILKKYLKNFVFPTPFELHYSITWNKAYESGEFNYTKQNKDPDLAAHITVTLNRGIYLYGKPIREVFHPIPEEYYIRSILYDLEDIQTTIQKDPVYGILNLCRVLYYIKEKMISSKDEAGVWALENLPERFRNVAKKALSLYGGTTEKVTWDKKELIEFSNYMMDMIK